MRLRQNPLAIFCVFFCNEIPTDRCSLLAVKRRSKVIAIQASFNLAILLPFHFASATAANVAFFCVETLADRASLLCAIGAFDGANIASQTMGDLAANNAILRARSLADVTNFFGAFGIADLAEHGLSPFLASSVDA
jgi:hypothetical protein